MGHVDEGDAHLLLDALELDLHILAELQVQGTQRLVQKQHLGPVHQSPGDGHPLLLAAGEGVGLAVLKALEADDLQHFHDPLVDLLLGNFYLPLSGGVIGVRPPLHPQAERNIFIDVQVRKQGVFLENGIDLPLIGRNVINPHTVEQDVSGRRSREAANDPQRGGLTAPAGSEQCEEFLVIDIKIDVIQYRFIVVHHAEIPQANQLFGHVSSPISIVFLSVKARLFSLLRGNLSRRNSAF